MFMRFVQLKISSRWSQAFLRFYQDIATPKLQSMAGCLFAGLVQSTPHSEEFISLTLWETQKQAEAYEGSGVYRELIEQIQPMLAESTEWKIQLSKDMELEYTPVPEEPVLKQLSVTAQTEEKENPPPVSGKRMHVRILSARIEQGKMEEFRTLYKSEILPALKKTPGCRYAYLSENLQETNEIISLTIWNSPQDVERYERSGQFDALTEKVKHTLSGLYQWKMALEKKAGSDITTTSDLKVANYQLVTGKGFK